MPLGPDEFPGGIQQMLWEMEQIKQLKARYFRFLDSRNWEEFAKLFTPDCRHIGYHGEGTVMDTFEEYHALLLSVLVPGRSVHHGHMPEISFTTPTEASGIWAMFDYVEHVDDDGTARAFMGYGHYNETYRKGSSGWQISSKQLLRIRVDDQPQN